MKRLGLIFILFTCQVFTIQSQDPLDKVLPVRGLCIAAPDKETLEPFIEFIQEELVPRKLNTLVLRIDYNYQYTSRPELANEDGLTKAEVKKLVNACREAGIRLIPQVNLLGHQSWFQRIGNLLKVYPEFNETPHVPMGDGSGDLEWPNEWGLYCLSYCPLHPEVHDVVFDVVDEIVEVFEADAFHAGMDEVFYLGDEKCPRCSGRDKAELFAGEVTLVRNHLAEKNVELWIWGDRLIDGKTTGIGFWEASYNNTHRAIDMIPKDVVINDWHYERPDPTAAWFALKGFNVVTCPWRFPEVTKTQLHMMVQFRKTATETAKDRYQGMLHTVWSSASDFLDQFYGRADAENKRRGGNQVEAFKTLFAEIGELEAEEE